VNALIITADDYGYAPAYDRGIVEAVDAGAVDAVSVMAGREGLDPWPLATKEVELGLHLELPDASYRRAAMAAVEMQLGAFRDAFRREPAFIDGHKHCHAEPGVAIAIARRGAELRAAVRSIDEGHRELVRSAGARTSDRLVGRMSERDPALPREMNELLMGGALPGGVTEWMVHPGHADPSAGSSYDRGRDEDLRLLLRLSEEPGLRRARATHAEALA
jgi:chitin disaccharide deacetylase